MNMEEFTAYAAKGYSRIPVYKKIPLDKESALSLYLKLGNTENTFILESKEQDPTWGRYSIVGLKANQVIQITNQSIQLLDNNETRIITDINPLDWFEDFHTAYTVPVIPDLPPFAGGYVGYFGYDAIDFIENNPIQTAGVNQNLPCPDILLMRADDLLVIDHKHQEIILISHIDPFTTHAFEKASEKIQNWIKKIKDQAEPEKNHIQELDLHDVSQYPLDENEYSKIFTQFQTDIKKDAELLASLPSRFCVSGSIDDLSLYQYYAQHFGSSHLYWLKTKNYSVIGSQYDMLVHKEDQLVQACLKPTTPDMLTLLDASRADLGKICEPGSLHVHQNETVSFGSDIKITGLIKASCSAIDVIRAILPSHQTSGVSKIPYMRKCAELYTEKRYAFGGFVGALGWHHSLFLSNVPETLIVTENKVCIYKTQMIDETSEKYGLWEDRQTYQSAWLDMLTCLKKEV